MALGYILPKCGMTDNHDALLGLQRRSSGPVDWKCMRGIIIGAAKTVNAPPNFNPFDRNGSLIVIKQCLAENGV